MKLTQVQQYMVLAAFAFLGLCFVFYQFLLKPINADIVAQRATLEQKQKDLEEAKKIVARYVEFKKRADSIQRELEWVQNRIPKTLDRSKMVEALSFIENRSEVSLTNAAFQPAVATKLGYVEVPVGISFNTNLQGLLAFLTQVSLSNLLMTVHDLAIFPHADPNFPKQTLTAQMTLSGIQAQ